MLWDHADYTAHMLITCTHFKTQEIELNVPNMKWKVEITNRLESAVKLLYLFFIVFPLINDSAFRYTMNHFVCEVVFWFCSLRCIRSNSLWASTTLISHVFNSECLKPISWVVIAGSRRQALRISIASCSFSKALCRCEKSTGSVQKQCYRRKCASNFFLCVISGVMLTYPFSQKYVEH